VTVSPEEHAAFVAGDGHLAAQAYHYLVLGDTPDALRIVADEAREIRALCAGLPATSTSGTDRSLVEAVRAIEAVASRSLIRGDAVQAMWCGLLTSQLAGTDGTVAGSDVAERNHLRRPRTSGSAH